MDKNLPECFATDARARGLRVELSPQHSFVLAHEHFLYSEYEGGKEETLRLMFVHHELVITGQFLRRIESGMQNRDLAWIAPRPERYQVLAPDRAFITGIALRPVKPPSGANHEDE